MRRRSRGKIGSLAGCQDRWVRRVRLEDPVGSKFLYWRLNYPFSITYGEAEDVESRKILIPDILQAKY